MGGQLREGTIPAKNVSSILCQYRPPLTVCAPVKVLLAEVKTKRILEGISSWEYVVGERLVKQLL